MGGGGGGITIYNILLFYSVFIFFVIYVSSFMGVTILTTSGNPNDIVIPQGLDILNPFVSIGFYIALASTTSSYTVLTIVLITPFVIVLMYALAQLARGTS